MNSIVFGIFDYEQEVIFYDSSRFSCTLLVLNQSDAAASDIWNLSSVSTSVAALFIMRVLSANMQTASHSVLVHSSAQH